MSEVKNEKMATVHNHAFDIAFSIDSLFSDPYECLEKEKDRLKKALLDRIDNVFESNEYAEAISYMDDTYDWECDERQIDLALSHFDETN